MYRNISKMADQRRPVNPRMHYMVLTLTSSGCLKLYLNPWELSWNRGYPQYSVTNMFENCFFLNGFSKVKGLQKAETESYQFALFIYWFDNFKSTEFMLCPNSLKTIVIPHRGCAVCVFTSQWQSWHADVNTQTAAAVVSFTAFELLGHTGIWIYGTQS